MKCPDCGCDNIAGSELCQECGSSLYELSLPGPKAGTRQKALDGAISELAPPDAVAVKPEDSVADAVKLMRRHKIGCVLVLRGKTLVGICTERDLLLRVAGLKDPAKTKISAVMKLHPQYLKETDSVAFAFHNMGVQGYRHIPISRENGKFGIISSRDLLAYLCH